MVIDTDGILHLYGGYYPVPGATTITHRASGISFESDGIHANTNAVYIDGVLYGSATNAPVQIGIRTGANFYPNPITSSGTYAYNIFAWYDIPPDVNISGTNGNIVAWTQTPNPAWVSLDTNGATTDVIVSLPADPDTTNTYYWTASYGGFTNTNSIAVGGPAEIASSQIVSPASVTENSSTQLKMKTVDDNGYTNDVTHLAVWDVTPPATITVSGMLNVGALTTQQVVTVTGIYGEEIATNNVTLIPDATPSVELAFYPAPTSFPPTTNYPAGFNTFEFVLWGSADTASPEVAEWTRQGNAGDTIALTGSNLDMGSVPDPDPIDATAYPDIAVTEPTTSYPVTFGAYTVNATNTTPATGTPEVAEWTRQADAGDTFALTGDNLE